jgi:short-subunit dehydrogenase
VNAIVPRSDGALTSINPVRAAIHHNFATFGDVTDFPMPVTLRNRTMDNPSGTRKTALVTGASSGIGLEIARLLAADGFALVLVARDANRLAEVATGLKRNHGVAVTVIPLDLSVPAAAGELFREVENQGIQVEILVNNAGFDVYGPFGQTDAQQEMQMIQVNVVALTQLTKLFLPTMMERKSGRILNLGSTASFAPCPFHAVYGASKAFVLSLSHALAEELRGTGITVTALCPGPTNTRFAARAGMTQTRLFQRNVANAADVARTGYRAMMRGQSSVVAGMANKLLVFSMRFGPREMVARISKGMVDAGRG